MNDGLFMLLFLLTAGALMAASIALLGRATRPIDAPTPEREPREIGWCSVILDDENGLGGAYGFVTEMTIGGEPWIRVNVPDDDDGWDGEVLYRLRDVREFAMADEETCREMAAEDQADDDVTELPPIGGQAVAEDKPN